MTNGAPPMIKVRYAVYRLVSSSPRIVERRLRTFEEQKDAEDYAKDYAARHGVPVTIARRTYVDGKTVKVDPDIAAF